MTEGAGTDPTKMSKNVSQSARRLTALHQAFTKARAARGNTPKNVMELGVQPGAARPAPTSRMKKPTGVPARGPKVSDAGLMNSSASGSAMGPAYMR